MFRYLLHGLPGHPLHPPLTDVTVGTYTFATLAALGDVTGLIEHNGAYAWWLALIVALASTVLTATTGFLDWIEIDWGSPVWRTATYHLTVMVTATVFFLVAAIVGHGGYLHGNVTAGAFILTLVGFGLLTLGGWLGGAIVFVHGMRVERD